jgi:magnesium transporter
MVLAVRTEEPCMKLFDRHRVKPGSAPGHLQLHPTETAASAAIRLISYGPEELTESEPSSAQELLPNLDASRVTWVDIVGLKDIELLRALGEHCGLHPLALEDVVNGRQRPKLEEYEDHCFVVMKLFHREEDLDAEQISIFFGKGYVITIQERPGDVFDPVRERIRSGRQRIRGGGGDYLVYALLDSLVDQFFPILEEYGEQIEALEEKLLERPEKGDVNEIQQVKKDLLQLRRAAWPQREVVSALERHEGDLVAVDTRLFLRDCYDHAVQIMDLLETYRDLASGLMDLYLSSVSNRMNEVMKVLTVMASIFIPLTFVAGIYGMNFNPDAGPMNMPELNWAYGYPAFWVVMIVVGGGMAVYFYRKRWF